MRQARALLMAGLIFVAPLSAERAQSLLDQAKAAFQNAQRMENALNAKTPSNRKRADYLNLIEAYQRVYLITPHTGYADDALIAVARLYEQIEVPVEAVKTLKFMIHDYPQTPYKAAAERDIERLQAVRAIQSPAEKPAAEKPADKPVERAERQKPSDSVPAANNDRRQTAIEGIRYLEGPNSVRVIIDASGDIRYAQGEVKSPDRVFLDLSATKLNLALLNKQWPVHSPVLQQIRVGQFDLTTVRVVLDLGASDRVTAFIMHEPDRLIIDVLGRGVAALSRVAENPYLAAPVVNVEPAVIAVPNAIPPAAILDLEPSAPPPPSVPPVAVAVASPVPAAAFPVTPAAMGAPTPAKPPNRGTATSLVRSLGLKISKVVIDAGHGGSDTGTIGPTGFTEKEFSLDLARRLKVLIETELGAEVVMTRNEDVFVPLETRTAIANKQQADLFISIHANSSKVASARGVETFYLNYPPPSRDALDLASRENASSQASIHELQDIIKKIMLNDKANESRELAGYIQKAMLERKDAGPDRGVKEAPFVVLIGANMPSILVEVGFISNPQEEKSAKTPAYRQQIAESLFKGIRSYTESLSGVKTANSYDKE